MGKVWFKAFATTESNDGPRVPIDAERIVFVLGEDDEGRRLEISVVLRDHGKTPPELGVWAIVEPTPDPFPGNYAPNLVVRRGPSTNVCHLSIWHQEREANPKDWPFNWRR
jgi:hypothetical protein